MKHASIALSWLAFACGPSVAVDDGTTSGDSSHDTQGSGPGSVTSPTTSPTTVSSTATSSPTTDPDSGVDTTADPDGGLFVGPQGDLPQECDFWLDDCPRGLKCMPWADDRGGTWNATKCSPIAEDPNQVGEPCSVAQNPLSGVDDCVARAMCWNVDPDTNMGECVAFCEGTAAEPTCNDVCSACHISADGPLILCLPGCNPLAQDCGEAQGCYPVEVGFACQPDASAEMGVHGDECEFTNVCDPGLFCAATDLLPDCPSMTGCCTPFCDLTSADPCPGAGPGVECIPWADAPPCTPAVLGACLLPE